MRSPEITESYGLATVEEGQKVDLSCKAIGNPSPKIKWKRRDGRKMNFLSRSGEIRSRKYPIFSRFSWVYLGIRFCPHHLACLCLRMPIRVPSCEPENEHSDIPYSRGVWTRARWRAIASEWGGEKTVQRFPREAKRHVWDQVWIIPRRQRKKCLASHLFERLCEPFATFFYIVPFLKKIYCKWCKCDLLS